MHQLTRRAFCHLAMALCAVPRLSAAVDLTQILRVGIERRRIPAAVGMTATIDSITYSGAFGTRDAESGVKVTTDSIFGIASMTKAITSVAALQLVEQGLLKLHEPVARHLPFLANLQILEGTDKVTGKPILRPAKNQVTLHHLLTHTSGLAYPEWNAVMAEYARHAPTTPGTVPPPVLVFEPGTRWQYGYSTDWAGRLVEVVSGQGLDQYFQRNIFDPLGMRDTGYVVPAEKFDRLVTGYRRQPDGSLRQNPRVLPSKPQSINGGGGLYSTAGDYVRFMQMILRRGRSTTKDAILQPATVEQMTSNQTGDLNAGRMTTFQPDRSSDVDFHPGAEDRFTLGFLINPSAYEGGRSAGSLAWAGLYNTFYWIDPRKEICAALLMQFLPFCDAQAMGLLRDFERAVYS
jgi:CubicO group peptidase (beta-lactamase class C family)